MGVCGSRRARDNVLLLCICAGAFGGTVRDVARANTIMCAIFDNTTAIAPDVTQLEKERLGQLGETRTKITVRLFEGEREGK